ncbi:MAG: calcium/sodium antiporter [Erysipelotrichales bacterium]|nr:calcium/sodium antiporter [Erysipelotrichales bacterium]
MFLEGLGNWTFGSTIVAAILLIVGLALIIKSGDIFVDASAWTADELHIPKFLIGVTIVSFATTLPELLVSIFAVIEGSYDIGIANAVGSVTANTGLILAISAIFVGSTINRKDFGIKGIIIILTNIILLAFCLTGKFGILPSVLLIILFIVHMTFTIISAKKNDSNVSKVIEIAEEVTETKKSTRKEKIVNILKFIFGAIGIAVGAKLLSDNAIRVATDLHIPEGIIGITIVAIGTSLPELVTTITSIVKKQGELGVGNVIGANIIDLVLILPVCSFIANGNLEVSRQAYMLDIPVLLVLSLIAVVPTLITKKFNKIQGILMLVIYIAYVITAAIVFVNK